MENDELLRLGKELTAKEDALWTEWLETNGRPGRDGGPVEELRRVRHEYWMRYAEIMERYEARGKE